MKARFSHVINDDICGITFIYFNPTYVQNLDNTPDPDYECGDGCIHLDEKDHHKLLDALKKEPTEHLTVFNEKEMNVIKDFMVPERGINKSNLTYDCLEEQKMTQEECDVFLRKLL